MRENPHLLYTYIRKYVCRLSILQYFSIELQYSSFDWFSFLFYSFFVLTTRIQWIVLCKVENSNHDVGISSFSFTETNSSMNITMANFWLCSLFKRFRLCVPWFGTSQSAKLFPLNFDSNYSQVPSCHYIPFTDPMGKDGIKPWKEMYIYIVRQFSV